MASNLPGTSALPGSNVGMPAPSGLYAPIPSANPTIPPGNPEYLGLVSDLFSAINTSAASFGQAAGQSALAAGDTQEAGAYGNAQAIANANASLALSAGQVEQAQTGLQVRKAIGAQQAGVAANGFGASGSALALLRSSTRQGLLQQQIIGMNAALESGGYQEQGAAASAEAAAATAAASSASALAASENAIGAASKTNAINEAAALGANIPGLSGLSGTNVASVPTDLLTGTTNGPTMLGGRMVSPQQPFII